MPKRVLFVITDSGVGGTEKVLTELLDRLNPNKFLICGVLVLKGRRDMGEGWEKNGISVRYFGLSLASFPIVLWRLWRSIVELKPDIVQAFLYHAVQLTRLVHIIHPSFKLISSPRVNYRFAPKWAIWVERLLNHQDSLAICESHSTRDFLLQNCGTKNTKLVVVPNGVDTSVFHFKPHDRELLRRQLGVLPNESLIGVCGRLHRQKGFDVFLKALRILMEKGGRFKSVIAGEGAELKSLTSYADAHHIPVQFLGLRKDMPALYSAMDIYVQSSRYEGMPNALLEALAVGLPSVATAVDGILDVANDKENCIMVPPEDANSLAEGLSLLISDSQACSSIKKQALSTAIKFSITETINKFENAYESTLT